MILVDTSIIISFLKGIVNEKTNKFNDILDKNIPFGINNVIYQEVLQGAKNEKEFEILQKYLSTQKFYELIRKRIVWKCCAVIFQMQTKRYNS